MCLILIWNWQSYNYQIFCDNAVLVLWSYFDTLECIWADPLFWLVFVHRFSWTKRLQSPWPGAWLPTFLHLPANSRPHQSGSCPGPHPSTPAVVVPLLLPALPATRVSGHMDQPPPPWGWGPALPDTASFTPHTQPAGPGASQPGASRPRPPWPGWPEPHRPESCRCAGHCAGGVTSTSRAQHWTAVLVCYRQPGECSTRQLHHQPTNRWGHSWLFQGFSQDFRIGCPKIHIWSELGVQFLFIPLHNTQKYG